MCETPTHCTLHAAAATLRAGESGGALAVSRQPTRDAMETLSAASVLLTVCLSTAALGAQIPYIDYAVRPCPKMEPVNDDVDSLLGPWHLALMLSDGPSVKDPDMCANVDVTRANASLLHLDWTIRQLNLPSGLDDVRLRVPAELSARPGSWIITTPIGGQMMATVTHTEAKFYMIMTVCGDRGEDGPLVHAFTALLTRTAPNILGDEELVRLARILLEMKILRKNQDIRLMNWGQC